jgi:hypothetical protein
MSKFLFIILFLFVVSETSAQDTIKSETYYSQSLGGLCSHTLVLFSNKRFKSEQGCEATSHVSFGTWRQNKDTITFVPIDIRKFKVIENVVSYKTPDKFLKVKVYDGKGNNITERVSLGQYVKGIGMFNMKLDSSKTERVDFKRENGIIMINSFQKVFRQRLELPADTLNNFEITLNIPDEWFFNPDADWDKSTFRLIKRKNKLFSLYPDQFSDGKIIVTEYVLQKEMTGPLWIDIQL